MGVGGGNADVRECGEECGGGGAEEIGERLVVGREGEEVVCPAIGGAKCAHRGWYCTRAVVQHEARGVERGTR